MTRGSKWPFSPTGLSSPCQNLNRGLFDTNPGSFLCCFLTDPLWTSLPHAWNEGGSTPPASAETWSCTGQVNCVLPPPLHAEWHPRFRFCLGSTSKFMERKKGGERENKDRIFIYNNLLGLRCPQKPVSSGSIGCSHRGRLASPPARNAPS